MDAPPQKNSNGNQRGEESRRRLIEAGLEIFGKYGFDGASTRMLAERADVNLAAIPYHFGSKEGLYRAVAEYIVTGIRERQAPVVERISTALQSDLSKEQALDLLHELLGSFGRMIIASDDADRWAHFVMREQMDPTPAFDILYGAVMSRLHKICSTLIGRLLDQPADDPEILLRTFTIMGQVLAFRSARAAVLKRLGWDHFDDAQVDHILAIVRQNTAAILHPSPGKTA